MLTPDAAVITNVDADHLDNYGTVAAYPEASFDAFRAPGPVPGGLLVTCADDPGDAGRWPAQARAPALPGASATASRPTRTT